MEASNLLNPCRHMHTHKGIRTQSHACMQEHKHTHTHTRTYARTHAHTFTIHTYLFCSSNLTKLVTSNEQGLRSQWLIYSSVTLVCSIIDKIWHSPGICSSLSTLNVWGSITRMVSESKPCLKKYSFPYTTQGKTFYPGYQHTHIQYNQNIWQSF